MTFRRAAVISASSSLLLLGACGGGGAGGMSGGGTVTPPMTPSQFTSFSSVQASTPTTVSGSTREGSLTTEQDGQILPNNISTAVEGTGSATITLNSAREVTALAISGSQSDVSFGAGSSGETLYYNGSPVAVAISNGSGSDQAVFGDPDTLGFNYQTFGVWGTGLVAGSAGHYGAVSVGAKTTASSVPTSGTATFNGQAGGIYVDGFGTFRYVANASFSVNFAGRAIDVTTSGDQIVSIESGVIYPTGTTVTGHMTYNAGSADFSGTFQAGSLMTGTGSGSFYGPSATELGGTFFLSGSGARIVGGFGAKQ